MEHEKEGCSCALRLTRRGFITAAGVSAASMAAAGHVFGAVKKEGAGEAAAHEVMDVVLKINGRGHALTVEPRWSLLYVLREKLGLTGAKAGCGRGECGACTVLIDDIPRYACMTLAAEAEDAEITTLEGLMDGEELGPVQQAFVEEDAYQCGYCSPGQIMAVEGLLRKTPDPGPADIRSGLSGNLCRCGAYVHIFRAARRAAGMKRKE